jgi:REP element-mobilizing transposase RayT
MAQSLGKLYTHIVFSTKNRAPLLHDVSVRSETHAYLGGICRNRESPPLAIGGTEDHVHILCNLSRKMAAARLIQALKRDSSRWIKSKGPDLLSFRWQEGYGVFSVSPSHVEALRKYIENQAEHHQQISFQDELRNLFRKYCIEYDERYVWD